MKSMLRRFSQRRSGGAAAAAALPPSKDDDLPTSAGTPTVRIVSPEQQSLSSTTTTTTPNRKSKPHHQQETSPHVSKSRKSSPFVVARRRRPRHANDADSWQTPQTVPSSVSTTMAPSPDKLSTTTTTPLSQDEGIVDENEQHNAIAKEAARLDKQGNALFEQGLYDDALASYEQALKLKHQSLGRQQDDDDDNNNEPDRDDPTLLANRRRRLSDGASDNSNASDYHNHSSHTRRRGGGSAARLSPEASILASMATSINNMTYLRQRSGQASHAETMASYLKSLQLKRQVLGSHHLSVGKTLNNIGSVFYLQQNYVPALKAYQDAHGIMLEQLGAEHLDVGTVFSNLGDCYGMLQDDAQSLSHYRQALHIRWRALGPHDPKVVRLMEQVAALETGRHQPTKAYHDGIAEPLSDSEDEEFAAQDRARHAALQHDVQVLQHELQEDLKFFDLMERQMAIDMVKDKTRIFREMRDLLEQEERGSGSQSPPATALPADRDVAAEDREMEALLSLPSISSHTAASDNADDVPQPSAPSSSPSTQHHNWPQPSLSIEERQKALFSVKDRLAKVRAQKAARQKELSETSIAMPVQQRLAALLERDAERLDDTSEHRESSLSTIEKVHARMAADKLRQELAEADYRHGHDKLPRMDSLQGTTSKAAANVGEEAHVKLDEESNDSPSDSARAHPSGTLASSTITSETQLPPHMDTVLGTTSELMKDAGEEINAKLEEEGNDEICDMTDVRPGGAEAPLTITPETQLPPHETSLMSSIQRLNPGAPDSPIRRGVVAPATPKRLFVGGTSGPITVVPPTISSSENERKAFRQAKFAQVQERMATLRAARQNGNTLHGLSKPSSTAAAATTTAAPGINGFARRDAGGQATKTVGHRSYMEPTAASRLRAPATSRRGSVQDTTKKAGRLPTAHVPGGK